MKPIFSDKASLVLRQMLCYPQQEWVVRDFEKELGVGRGWAGKVLAFLREKGYLKGEARGRAAFAVLRNREDLIQEWVRDYDFAMNNNRHMVTDKKYEEPTQGSYQEVIWLTGYTSTQVMAESVFAVWKAHMRYETEFFNEATKYAAVAALESEGIFYITYIAATYG